MWRDKGWQGWMNKGWGPNQKVQGEEGRDQGVIEEQVRESEWQGCG